MVPLVLKQNILRPLLQTWNLSNVLHQQDFQIFNFTREERVNHDDISKMTNENENRGYFILSVFYAIISKTLA